MLLIKMFDGLLSTNPRVGCRPNSIITDLAKFVLVNEGGAIIKLPATSELYITDC